VRTLSHLEKNALESIPWLHAILCQFNEVLGSITLKCDD
jgi:hypothetical protein